MGQQRSTVPILAAKRLNVHLPNVGLQAHPAAQNVQKTSIVVVKAPRPQGQHKYADNDPHRRPDDSQNAEFYFIAI
jgi:hypothetical protein